MVQGIWNALKQLIQNNRLRILLIGHISPASRLNKVAFAKMPCNILTIDPMALNFFEFFSAVPSLLWCSLLFQLMQSFILYL